MPPLMLKLKHMPMPMLKVVLVPMPMPMLFREHGVDVVTLGQYMRPTKKHMAVSDFVTPQAFDAYREIAEGMGFAYVARWGRGEGGGRGRGLRLRGQVG